VHFHRQGSHRAWERAGHLSYCVRFIASADGDESNGKERVGVLTKSQCSTRTHLGRSRLRHQSFSADVRSHGAGSAALQDDIVTWVIFCGPSGAAETGISQDR
jgi:hypothetical protein